MRLSRLKPILITLGTSVIIVLIFIIGSILFSNNNESKNGNQGQINNQSKQPSPATIPQKPEFKNELEKIIESLPIQGDGFSIEYVKPINLINGKITANSAEEFITVKIAAENALKDKGVQDLCVLNVFWIAQTTQQIRKSIEGKNFITTGCAP
ncbi:TPA: hypothetical protein DIV55_01705 [Patescibacteria group bacterium]|nr:hypothetical protein [Patescibacteria group bacterium]